MRRILGAFTALVLAILYAPTILMVVFSFNQSRYAIRWTGFTLNWYREMLGDHQLGMALSNTIIISTGSALLAVMLGTMAALAMRRVFPGKRIFATVVSLPLMIPDIVLAVSILAMIYAAGMRPSLLTAIAANTTFNLSYVAVVVSARLDGLDGSLELAAQDLGATPFRAFWNVTIPAILPGVVSGALLAFTMSFDDFVITYFTTGPGDTPLAVRIYSMMRGEVSPEINAISTVILAVSLVLIVAALRIGSAGKVMQSARKQEVTT
jgi:spermidine/putrescine transport system permease protein